jgi:hypothetical protein
MKIIITINGDTITKEIEIPKAGGEILLLDSSIEGVITRVMDDTGKDISHITPEMPFTKTKDMTFSLKVPRPFEFVQEAVLARLNNLIHYVKFVTTELHTLEALEEKLSALEPLTINKLVGFEKLKKE